MSSGPSDKLPRYIPCNKEYVVPLNVRPQFADQVTLGKILKLTPLASDPVAPYVVEGAVYYNSASHVIKCYNGTSWLTITMA